jgi:hypothetical protein
MKTKRNDPCPCGSGLKYKKCCMSRDDERAAENPELIEVASESPPGTEAISAPAPRGSIKPSAQSSVRAADPEEIRWMKFESRWESADYEGRIAMYTEAFSDDERMVDPEEAWELLSDLYVQTIEHGQRDRYDALVDALREHRPEAYARDEMFHLRRRIANALASGRFEDVAPLARAAGKSGSKDPDIFSWVIDQLMYHGRISELIDMLRLARAWVSDTGELTPWALDEFKNTSCRAELLDHMQQHAPLKPDDPALLERLKLHVDPDPELIAERLGRLAGTADSQWTPADFQAGGGSRPKKKRDRTDSDDARINHNVWSLAEEFAGHAARNRGVAPTRAELARQEIIRYIRARHDGDLDDRRSMYERMTDPRKKIPAAADSPDYHILCPDRETLDCFLADNLASMSPQPYKIAVLFELIPLWLAFLESNSLLSAERRRQAMEELAPLGADLSAVVGRYTDDPAVGEGVMQYWNAGRIIRPDSQAKTGAEEPKHEPDDAV